MHSVKIKSQNKHGEDELNMTITATTRKGARRKATNWIQKHICESDYERVEKYSSTPTLDHWWLT